MNKIGVVPVTYNSSKVLYDFMQSILQQSYTNFILYIIDNDSQDGTPKLLNMYKNDKIKIRKGDTEFEETIDSMQIDHKNVDSAKKGDDVAIKLSEKTKEGAIVYLIK